MGEIDCLASFCTTAKESLAGAVTCAAVCSGSGTLVLQKRMEKSCLPVEPRRVEHSRADGSGGKQQEPGSWFWLELVFGTPRTRLHVGCVAGSQTQLREGWGCHHGPGMGSPALGGCSQPSGPTWWEPQQRRENEGIPRLRPRSVPPR